MTVGWQQDAAEILQELQRRVSARDLEALLAMFEEPSMLIGTAGDGRNPAARRHYLRLVVTQPGALRWDWQETHRFYQAHDALGFAAFGELVVADGATEERAPIRATLFAVRSGDGWRLREFHGSIPHMT
jgi:hypothetical protein